LRALGYAALALALALAALPSLAAGPTPLPNGWILSGTNAKNYGVALSHKSVHSGKTSAVLGSRTDGAHGFGTLMQEVGALPWRGKRVRLSAFVHSQKVAGWAGLWMRVDGPDRSRPLAFDNMQERPIRGDSGWVEHSVVLDVPAEALAIAFGVLLHGSGRVWIDGVRLEAVDASVPVTAAPQPQLRGQPVNLDFEE
jgi:hypothetical protein